MNINYKNLKESCIKFIYSNEIYLRLYYLKKV